MSVFAQPTFGDAPVQGLEREYAPGFEAEHTHEQHAQVMYAVTGSMTVSTSEGIWVLPPQRALWIPAGVLHTFKHSRPISLRAVYVRQDTVGIPPWKSCSVLNVSTLVRELILACAQLPESYALESREARLGIVLLDHLALLQQDAFYLPEPNDKRAVKAANLIKANPDDARALKDIAHHVGASPRTLERLFSAQTGMGFGAWRQRLRMMVALENLAAGESVSSTAAAIGYESSSSFIAVFRSVFGCSPAKYFAKS
ncbi:helix-turn-helix transcriptional regulator [Pseudomonas gingeri]|uniref:AraC family transcriptional regulator n=1 Tax=Pseudomonas gingeri TaxID=117681 RepID=UPI0015A2C742|nr:helix-turn-helix transcriptional regulator [Pseudomonas gingeri]NVZ27814.1 helix-turn-helix transcriptional regulator [Pseudomonas gingeri]